MIKLNQISTPLKTSVYYLVFSTIYIFSSDYILSLLIDDPQIMTYFQTYKGTAYVITTALLLYLGLSRRFKKLEAEQLKREEAEDILLDQNYLLEVIIKNFPNSYIIINKDYLIELAAGSEFNSLKITPEYLKGKHISKVSPKISFNLNDYYEKVFEGDIQKFEIKVDENLYFYFNVLSLYNHNNVIDKILIIAENISDRKSIENNLRRAKNEAEKASNLKTDFLAQMSHEIRTPVSTILNYLNIISEVSANNNGEMNNYLTSINNASQRLIRTIDTILNMSELQKGLYIPNYSKINLKDLILKIYDDHKDDAVMKNLEIKTMISGENFIVTADTYSVEQILHHITNNAINLLVMDPLR